MSEEQTTAEPEVDAPTVEEPAPEATAPTSSPVSAHAAELDRILSKFPAPSELALRLSTVERALFDLVQLMRAAA